MYYVKLFDYEEIIDTSYDGNPNSYHFGNSLKTKLDKYWRFDHPKNVDTSKAIDILMENSVCDNWPKKLRDAYKKNDKKALKEILTTKLSIYERYIFYSEFVL
jgi:hypothetical protein